MLLNIEIKAPVFDEKRKQTYSTDLAAEKVIELIKWYDIGHKVMISSFNSEMIKSVERASMSAENRAFIVMPLLNGRLQLDPNDYVVQGTSNGISISADFFNSERTAKVDK